MSITTATTTTGTMSGEGGGGDPPEELDLGAGYVDMSSETVQTTDLNFLMCGEQLQGFMAGPGKEMHTICNFHPTYLIYRWCSCWY